MTTAFVLFPPPYVQRDAWLSSVKPQLIAAYEDNRYKTAGALDVRSLTGTAAAEECFDLTNNPSRQAQRDMQWAGNRPVSVGDIVRIGDEAWLCASFGWEKIEKAPQ